jgi:hypothetical protein
MKKIALILFVLLIIPSILSAGSFRWDAVTVNVDGTPATDISGYNIYNVTVGRIRINVDEIPSSACVSGFCEWSWPGTFVNGDKFVVTATDSGHTESGDSRIATVSVSPTNPANFILKLP